MTERVPSPPHAAAPRRTRLSKRTLRAWAWIAGGAALFTPLAALASQPKVGATTTVSAPRPVIIKRVVHRVVIVSAIQPTAPARIVYAGGGSSSGGSTSGGTVAAPAPVATTGGSAPPP
jgi:hypothetical protein